MFTDCSATVHRQSHFAHFMIKKIWSLAFSNKWKICWLHVITACTPALSFQSEWYQSCMVKVQKKQKKSVAIKVVSEKALRLFSIRTDGCKRQWCEFILYLTTSYFLCTFFISTNWKIGRFSVSTSIVYKTKFLNTLLISFIAFLKF